MRRTFYTCALFPLAVVFVLAGCDSFSADDGSGTTVSATTLSQADTHESVVVADDGKLLYDTFCAFCHGSDTDPLGWGGSTGEDVRGESAEETWEAIAEVTEMQWLGDVLTAEDVDAIGEYLQSLDEDEDGQGEEAEEDDESGDQDHHGDDDGDDHGDDDGDDSDD